MQFAMPLIWPLIRPKPLPEKTWRRPDFKRTQEFYLTFRTSNDIRHKKQPPELFYKIAPRHSAIFTGKHLCWSIFLIKFQAIGLQIYLKRHQHTCFLVIIANFLRTLIFKNICRRLLLSYVRLNSILYNIF